MNTRFKMGKVYPAAYKAMDALDTLTKNSLIDKWHREMIRIRASHINGCAYCVHSHSSDALELGVDFHKINLVPVWREAPNVFNEEEQLILEMTEQVTLIHQHGLRDELYNKAISLWGEEKTAHTLMLMITINAWNRIGVGLNLHPDYKSSE